MSVLLVGEGDDAWLSAGLTCCRSLRDSLSVGCRSYRACELRRVCCRNTQWLGTRSAPGRPWQGWWVVVVGRNAASPSSHSWMRFIASSLCPPPHLRAPSAGFPFHTSCPMASVPCPVSGWFSSCWPTQARLPEQSFTWASASASPTSCFSQAPPLPLTAGFHAVSALTERQAPQHSLYPSLMGPPTFSGCTLRSTSSLVLCWMFVPGTWFY